MSGLPLAVRGRGGRLSTSSASTPTRPGQAPRGRRLLRRGRRRRDAAPRPWTPGATSPPPTAIAARASTSPSSTCPRPLADGVPDLAHVEEAARMLGRHLPSRGHRHPRVDDVPRDHRGARRRRSSRRSPGSVAGATSTSATAPSASTPATPPGTCPTSRRSSPGSTTPRSTAVQGFYDRIVARHGPGVRHDGWPS